MRNIVLVIEEAKAEITAAVTNAKARTGLPYAVMDGVISSILADIRKDALVEQAVAAAEEIERLREDKKEGTKNADL